MEGVLLGSSVPGVNEGAQYLLARSLMDSFVFDKGLLYSSRLVQSAGSSRLGLLSAGDQVSVAEGFWASFPKHPLLLVALAAQGGMLLL